MGSYTRWKDIRAEHVERAGGEAVVAAGKAELLAQVIGHRLAEIRRARGFTQLQIAERMGSRRVESPRLNAERLQDRTSWRAMPQLWAVDCTSRSTSTTATSPPSRDAGFPVPISSCC